MRNLPATILCLSLAAGALFSFSGCDSDKAQPVSTQDFYSRHTLAANPISPVDHPGIISLPDARSQPPAVPEAKPGDSQPGISPGDFQPSSVPPPTISISPTTGPSATTMVSSATQPATQSSTQPDFATDQFMTVGSVVTVVNGRPIFANKVLRLDIDILREKAKEYDRERFKIFARTQIERTVEQLTEDELEVAAAERTLDPKDLQLAQAFTHLWAQNQIAEAGGSEQVVRLRAHASGEDFEDLEQDQYRYYLQQLYYYKKIYPRIDYTAADEREYYRKHIDEFTTPAEASIILIEADPAKHDGNDGAAKSKLLDIRHRALAGEDFADYGKKQNDLPGATGEQGNGGAMSIKPNTFVLSNVEAAVWKTPAGQISDIIEDHDAFYIFKVLTKDEGGTKSFADSKVQEGIKRRLIGIQFQQRREAEYRKLIADKIASPENIEPVLEMAMQNYPKWSQGKH
jgi:parvulin-like peptidyl-prolyl isomerase